MCFSQNNDNTLLKYDSLVANSTLDSTISVLSNSDSLTLSADSLAQEEIGDIETTIKYSAKDSIQMDVSNQLLYLYGEAHIIYGEIELTASQIEVNYSNSIISAKGSTDSLGNEIGKPVFKDGNLLEGFCHASTSLFLSGFLSRSLLNFAAS